MTQQRHDLSNINVAYTYLERLSSDDVSRRYAAGEKYASSVLNRLKLLFGIDSTLSELNNFYPYQPIVKGTYQVYKEKKEKNQRNALIFSGCSIFTVYQMAKQGYVMPIFSQFGKFMKTHRLLRQYVWLAFFPYFFATAYTNNFFLNQTERLWQTHANRLNRGILSDPEDSQYPREELELSQVYTWKQPWTHPYDLPKKRANQVPIFLAPDYAPVEEWEAAPVDDPVEEQDDEEEE